MSVASASTSMDEAWAVVLEQPKSAEDQQVDNLVSDFKRELIEGVYQQEACAA